jgi:helicase MOV-10
MSASMMEGIGLDDHFTHIFVDEAGYAMEPECLISVAGLANQ